MCGQWKSCSWFDSTPFHTLTHCTTHAQIREAFAALGHWPSEEKLRLLLAQAGGRMATLEGRRAAAAALRARVTQKQRANYYNKLHRARLRELKRLRFGMGWRPSAAQARAFLRGRPVGATWRQRRLKPPGSMGRRF